MRTHAIGALGAAGLSRHALPHLRAVLYCSLCDGAGLAFRRVSCVHTHTHTLSVGGHAAGTGGGFPTTS
eukprot:2589801-Amphidinium_carterae.2